MATGKAITKDERTQLKKIVDERFRVLRAQIAQREMEAEQIIRGRIMKEKEDQVAEARERMLALQGLSVELAEGWREMQKWADDNGMQVNSYRIDFPEFANIKVSVKDIDSRVKTELFAMRTAAGGQHVSLHEQQLKLHEELILSSLETDAARKFLDSIPTVDSIMPLPERMVKEIEAKEVSNAN